MKDVRVNLTENEKLARVNSGLESEAKHFYMNNQRADEILEREARTKFNEKVDEYIEKFDKHSEALQEYAKEIADNAANLEIMPIGNNILIKPFAENPFQKIQVSDSGLIVDLGGQAPTYKSNETGEYEEEEQFIHVGTVLEAGTDCKFIQEGDTVMWTKTSEIPVPFFKQGLVLVNENRIIVVINEGLKARFENK